MEQDCPGEVSEFAATMLHEVSWRPDPLFMLDVGESEGQLWLIEVNGLSCSWLYQCDLQAVIAAASEIAGRAWARSLDGRSTNPPSE